jgi:hypothetical protein
MAGLVHADKLSNQPVSRFVLSTLAGAEGQPSDELLLQGKEHDQHRKRYEHRAGRQQVVVGEELAAQVVSALVIGNLVPSWISTVAQKNSL